MATNPRIRYDIEARASGATDVEKLAQEFEKLDGAFPEDLAGKVRQASVQLQELGQQQQAVKAFARIKAETEQAKQGLQDAQQAAQKFAATLADTEQPTRAQAGQLQKLRDAVKAAKDEVLSQTLALDAARQGLSQFGVSGEQAAARSVALRQQIGAVKAELSGLFSQGASAAGFQQLVRDTDAARLRMEQTAQAADKLAAELAQLQRPTDGEAAKLRELRAAADEAAGDFKRLQAATVEQGVALRQAGANTERLTASARESAAAQQQAATAAQRTAVAYTEQGVAATRAAGQQAAAAKSVNEGLAGIGAQLRSIQTLALSALGAQAFAGQIGEVFKTADAYNNLASRIGLVTGQGEALKSAFDGVFQVATRTNSSLDSTGTLFQRIATTGKDAGLSVEEASAQALRLTETINQAVQLSGSSAQASDAAITQLIQGLQSGVLRGEEFNSVMEQAPRLARALADGLGVTTGELRKLAEAGSLSAQTVINALQGQSAALKREFDQLPPTVGRALQNLSTEWTRYVAEVDKANGASAAVAGAIQSLAQNLDTVGNALAIAGKAVAAYLAVDLAKSLYARAAAAAASAAAQQAETATVAAGTAAIAANSAALATNTAAKATNTAATATNAAAATAGALAWGSLEKGVRIGAAASVEAAAKTSILGAAFSALSAGAGAVVNAVGGLPTILIATLLNARELGTGMGELAAKLLGAKDRTAELAAEEAALKKRSGEVAAAKAEQAQKLQLAADKALGLTEQSKKLVAEFDGVIKAGGSTSDALDKVQKSLDFKSPKSINDSVTALYALEKQGKITGDQVRQSIEIGLNGLDLSTFKINAIAAFDGTEQGAEKLRASLDALSREALRRVGTSAEELKTGLSTTFTKALNDVDAVREELEKLGVKAEQSAPLVAKALDQALNAATTEKAVEEVIRRYEKLGKTGEITGQQLADGLQKAKEKLDEIKPGINSTEEAFKRLGITSQAQAKKTADEYSRAYEKIAGDATVAVGKKIEAFEKWAKAATEANGGVETSEVKLQREILNIQAKAAGLGDEFVKSMGKAKEATEEATKSLNAMATSASSAFDAATKARKEADLSVLSRNVDSSGFSTGAGGARIGSSQQLDLNGGTFDVAAFNRDVRNAALTGMGVPDPKNYIRRPSGTSGVITAAEAQAQFWTSNGSAGFSPLGRFGNQQAAMQQQQQTPKTPGSVQTTIVKIQLPDGSSNSITVGSAADATALTNLISFLTSSARSAGVTPG